MRAVTILPHCDEPTFNVPSYNGLDVAHVQELLDLDSEPPYHAQDVWTYANVPNFKLRYQDNYQVLATLRRPVASSMQHGTLYRASPAEV